MRKKYQSSKWIAIALILTLMVTGTVVAAPKMVYAEDEQPTEVVTPENPTQQDPADEGDTTFADLCINEVCAEEDANGALHKINTVEGGYYDWVEIYNRGDEATNAGSFYITDKKKKPQKYQLPEVTIEPHGYLIIFCGDAPETLAEGEYISGFGISKNGGETVFLTDGESILDQLDVTKSALNMTTSRYPDGGSRVTLTEATPNAPNGYTVSAPEFSHNSGFYDPFTLTMTAEDEDATIYYTTDGTVPTEESAVYTEGLEIEDVSSNDNVYSARTDISTLYNKKLLKKYKMLSFYQQAPKKNVDKISRVRAICIDSAGKQSAVTSAVYFVGLGDKPEYQNVNLVSLQASDYDLWDYNKGIYVLGARYTGKKKDKIVGTTKYAMRFLANYYNRRAIWGNVDYFDNSQAEAVNETAQMTLKGHISRAYPQKSWNVKGKKNSFTLEIDGNDPAYKLKDPTGSLLADGLKVEKSDYEPCQVFLNGEYWGFYHRGERLFSKSHYTEKYGVDKDTVAIIKRYKLNEGTKKDLKDYKSLLNYIKKHNMRKTKYYNHVKARIDIDSMIDYYCIEIFAANMDWRPNWNYGVWRSSQYNNGKWNYILWDLNNVNCFINKNKNMMKFTFSQDPYFKALYKNKTFKRKFKNRFNQLAETNFSPTNAVANLTSVYERDRVYTVANMGRYYEETKTIEDYDNYYNRMKTFLQVRAKICQKHIKAAK